MRPGEAKRGHVRHVPRIFVLQVGRDAPELQVPTHTLHSNVGTASDDIEPNSCSDTSVERRRAQGVVRRGVAGAHEVDGHTTHEGRLPAAAKPRHAPKTASTPRRLNSRAVSAPQRWRGRCRTRCWGGGTPTLRATPTCAALPTASRRLTNRRCDAACVREADGGPPGGVVAGQTHKLVLGWAGGPVAARQGLTRVWHLLRRLLVLFACPRRPGACRMLWRCAASSWWCVHSRAAAAPVMPPHRAASPT